MPDGLILADMDGRIVTANASAAEIFGVAEADLPGQPVGRLIPDTACASIRTAVTRQERFSDLEAVPEGKEDNVVSIAGALVRNPDGEPAGIVLIIRDITGRKAAETALRTASQKLSLLSRVTCHDIGNDVTALSWYLNLLSEDRMHPDAGTHLSRSVEIVERIKEHLNFSREYQMVGAYQPVWQPLEPMVAQAVSGVHLSGVEISTRMAPVEVYADRLSPKVVYNLVENAVRHSPSDRPVRLCAAAVPGQQLQLRIVDQGPGVADSDRELMFEPFQRLGDVPAGSGVGLGLAVARGLAEAVGASVEAEETPGGGLTMVVSVPLAPTSSTERAAS